MVPAGPRLWRRRVLSFLCPHAAPLPPVSCCPSCCCAGTIPHSVQLAHFHSSQPLRRSHVLLPVPPCTDVSLLSRTSQERPRSLAAAGQLAAARTWLPASLRPPSSPSVLTKNSHYILVLLEFPFLGFLPKGPGFLPKPRLSLRLVGQ